MTALVWFRHDLRTLDNTALTETARQGPVRGVYFLCPQQLDEHVIAPIRRHYMRRVLDDLAAQLAALGIPFDIVEAGHFRDVPKHLADYCAEHDIEQVFAHREWLVDERRRDVACEAALSVPLVLVEDNLLGATQVMKGDGDPYKVFTPFSRQARQQIGNDFPVCRRRPKAQGDAYEPARCPVFGEEVSSESWPACEEGVLSQLRRFCAERAESYKAERDFPDLDRTSRLSAALSLGVISPRQCLSRLRTECGEAIWDAKSGPGSWMNELLWREFYRYIAYHFPRVVMGRAFQPETEALKWGNDQALFEAWQQGQTGYPIVDAAMRQLAQTGWMHNRLRMIAASFLCKHLHIDWRWGERHFLEQLIDADFASNNGGWQWGASTGTDAAPYFRIFNPTTQAQKFDPDGRFITHYVPELKGLSGKALFQPSATDNYPPPIVEHRWARETTLSLFQALK